MSNLDLEVARLTYELAKERAEHAVTWDAKRRIMGERDDAQQERDALQRYYDSVVQQCDDLRTALTRSEEAREKAERERDEAREDHCREIVAHTATVRALTRAEVDVTRLREAMPTDDALCALHTAISRSGPGWRGLDAAKEAVARLDAARNSTEVV